MIHVNKEILNVSNFPDNETIIRYSQTNKSLNIVWRYENDAELIALGQLYNIINRCKNPKRTPKTLYIPYFPHARQDRSTTPDSPCSLEVFFNLLSSIIADTNTQLVILDPHSGVIGDMCLSKEGLFDFKFINSSFYSKYVPQKLYDAVICPDSGALTRTLNWWHELIDSDSLGTAAYNYKIGKYEFTDSPYVKFLNSVAKIRNESRYSGNMFEAIPVHHSFIICSKTRNPSTGKLSDPRIDDHESIKKAKKAIIIDDIGTGFGTHIQLGKLIKEYNPGLELDLFVSHSSFTKGENDVLQIFNHVFTTDSLVQGNRIVSDRISRFNCEDCILDYIC